MKRILSVLVPEAPILVGAALLVTLPALRPAANGLVAFYVALLAITQYVLDGGVATPEQRLFFHATTFLLPFNLALVALLPERGTVTPAGLVRWVLIAVQVMVVAFLARSFPADATALLRTRFLPSVLTAWTPLAQPAVAAFLAIGTLLVLAWLREPQSPVRAYAYALIAAFLCLTWKATGPGQEIWIATSGLVLVVAVVEASYMMAYRDGLTELPGRRALNEALPRLSGQFTVAMVDVDHFKRFNDQYGHDAGDHVLRLVAARLAHAPGGATAYRYGGEEFALIFSGKGAEECLPHLEELRETVETSHFTMRRRFRPRNKPPAPKGRKTREAIVITVSIGVAEKNHRHSTPDQVVQAADKALYRAKESGRNRVSV